MIGSLVHRGPDDEGVYISPDGLVGLANRRLAIRDLSPAGHMPMGNARGTAWITYNGEIYNTGSLRAELEQLGYIFHSTSDTEVILHGYEAWGEEVVPRLQGMFALAIVQVEETTGQVQQLLLARDHLGIKPLYYAAQNGRLAFASELRALLAAQLVSDEIDPTALAGYLMLGAVPNPLTIYCEAKALPPATWLTWQDGHMSLHTYWQMPVETAETTDQEAVEMVRQLLQDAVRRRLVSDVPLGAFLSGGLDSSIVVALMRQVTAGTIRTCSVVFGEKTYNEAPYARAMAEAIGAEHYERLITANDVRKEFERILQAMDQPSVDGVNMYFVSQTARQAGLTVALSGLGGDELFGGYANTFQGVPQMLRVIRYVQQLPGGPTMVSSGLERLTRQRHWRRVGEAVWRPASAASAYVVRRGLFAPEEARSLLNEDLASGSGFDPVRYVSERVGAGAPRDGTASTNWVSRAEMTTYMHQQLLRDADVMSMAHSLEVRVPFIDRVLVEMVLRLPERLLRTGDGPKPLLLRAMGGDLPKMIRQRGDKRGFTFPFAEWLRMAVRPEMQAALEKVKARGWLKPAAMDATWRDYEAGRAHWSRVWALAALNSIA